MSFKIKNYLKSKDEYVQKKCDFFKTDDYKMGIITFL